MSVATWSPATFSFTAARTAHQLAFRPGSRTGTPVGENALGEREGARLAGCQRATRSVKRSHAPMPIGKIGTDHEHSAGALIEVRLGYSPVDSRELSSRVGYQEAIGGSSRERLPCETNFKAAPARHSIWAIDGRNLRLHSQGAVCAALRKLGGRVVFWGITASGFGVSRTTSGVGSDAARAVWKIRRSKTAKQRGRITGIV